MVETTARDVREEKEYAERVLDDMGLNQIANWLRVLPEDRWEELFVFYWPTLARKCGIRT
ncbi:hypothetical protein P9314_16200 [Paenibacillus validus]|uniref:Uncharacterized protein n=1 Tax=Paenibacillus validus TaxID=44253 RepID=A0A7X2Z8F9_9BACL|nr:MULTISPECIES: hypothetical protein [Paenibacillus]MED4602229.1 hypothetical protein [Paenibacillus validus]MED4607395.1 hypothetical protein [Paenibacillus validus]MUG70219.1 hypothetical protein [Paenibacillus validus]